MDRHEWDLSSVRAGMESKAEGAELSASVGSSHRASVGRGRQTERGQRCPWDREWS